MKNIIFLSLFCILLSAHSAQPLMLVTPEEVFESNSAPTRFLAKSVPEKDAPVIQIINPKNFSAVTSPTPVEIKFQSVDQSTVKPETFRVLYGTFQIDITKRILNVTKVTTEGVVVQAANLPTGKHKLILNIEDNQGRTGSQLVEFEVK